MATETVGIVGAGGWGTALAIVLAGRGVPVRLWAFESEQVAEMRATRRNGTYLPGVEIPGGVEFTGDLGAMSALRTLVFVTPSKGFRATAKNLAALGVPADATLLSCTKGIEHGSGYRMSQILAEFFPGNPLAVLSGPSHAEEVARGVPTAVVIGSAQVEVATRLQALFAARAFRAYTADDVTGIELGGALKNIYALAAGVSDGLGLGDNTKAALVTRSLAELIRLGRAMGGKAETFMGLSGIGDLMVTCFSRHSRNRGFGERLGRGETTEAIAASTKMVAEGVPTARSAFACARQLGAVTPVLDQVHALLEGACGPAAALDALLQRELRPEAD